MLPASFETQLSVKRELVSIAEYTDVPVRLVLWQLDDDDVIYANIPLSALKHYGSVVRDDLIEELVQLGRAVASNVPLRAGVIGEEAIVGAALLDLWQTSRGPVVGDPGTLWPVGDTLEWFPLEYDIPLDSV